MNHASHSTTFVRVPALFLGLKVWGLRGGGGGREFHSRVKFWKHIITGSGTTGVTEKIKKEWWFSNWKYFFSLNQNSTQSEVFELKPKQWESGS